MDADACHLLVRLADGVLEVPDTVLTQELGGRLDVFVRDAVDDLDIRASADVEGWASAGVFPTSMVNATSGRLVSARTLGEVVAEQTTICSPFQRPTGETRGSPSGPL